MGQCRPPFQPVGVNPRAQEVNGLLSRDLTQDHFLESQINPQRQLVKLQSQWVSIRVPIPMG
jgi:hypothetical protein